MSRTPRGVAEASIAAPQLPDGTDERFVGYGVMGLPFSSGHYLALRHFPETSLGRGYRSVWHRDPHGRWTIHADVPPHLGCARYFGSALAGTELAPITLTWTDPHALTVTAGDWLSWELRIQPSTATRVMNGMGRLLPDAAWRSDAVLRVMGRVAGPMLGLGRVRLQGTVPNGQHFRASPRLTWTVADSSASIMGQDIGTGSVAQPRPPWRLLAAAARDLHGWHVPVRHPRRDPARATARPGRLISDTACAGSVRR